MVRGVVKDLKQSLTESLALLNSREAVDQAGLNRNLTDPLQGTMRIRLDLSAAQNRASAYTINFPHKSFCVVGATRQDAQVFYIPNTSRDGAYDLPIGLYDEVEFYTQQSSATFYWGVFDNTVVDIWLFSDGRMNLGKRITPARNYPEIISAKALAVGAVTASATLVVDPVADTNLVGTNGMSAGIMYEMHLQNPSGGSSVWYGDSAVTTSTGIELAAGATLVWNTQSTLYMIGAGAGPINIRRVMVYKSPSGLAGNISLRT